MFRQLSVYVFHYHYCRLSLSQLICFPLYNCRCHSFYARCSVSIRLVFQIGAIWTWLCLAGLGPAYSYRSSDQRPWNVPEYGLGLWPSLILSLGAIWLWWLYVGRYLYPDAAQVYNIKLLIEINNMNVELMLSKNKPEHSRWIKVPIKNNLNQPIHPYCLIGVWALHRLLFSRYCHATEVIK